MQVTINWFFDLNWLKENKQKEKSFTIIFDL